MRRPRCRVCNSLRRIPARALAAGDSATRVDGGDDAAREVDVRRRDAGVDDVEERAGAGVGMARRAAVQAKRALVHAVESPRKATALRGDGGGVYPEEARVERKPCAATRAVALDDRVEVSRAKRARLRRAEGKHRAS